MGVIQLRTPVPGPRSRELQRRREIAVPRGLSQATPVYVARAEGALLEDVDGNTFIDLAGGIGCLNVGHRDAGVVSAIQGQVERHLHTCAQVTPYESYVALAEKLNQITPGDFAEKDAISKYRRRRGGERDQGGAGIHQASSRHLLRRCVSRTHAHGAGFDEQNASL